MDGEHKKLMELISSLSSYAVSELPAEHRHVELGVNFGPSILSVLLTCQLLKMILM